MPETKMKILLVEDEQENIQVITEQLEAGGMQVFAADKPSAALKMMANQKFDCLLVDIHLGASSGDQLIAQLRKDRKNLNYETPVVVVSAHLERDLVLNLRNLINGALVKPFRQQELIKRIQMVTGVRAAA
jgi:two-component system, OmpR family, sensor histidine kinase TorS